MGWLRCSLQGMSTARRLHQTYEQYLRALEESTFKLEYCDGEIYMMAGGSPTHAQLGARAIRLLGTGLGPPCEVYSSDLKVRVEASDLSTFPDATVVCGPRVASPIDAQAITNPSLVVEVTSPTTEDYDRGDKLSHYKQLASLSAVLFVSHRSKRVTVVQRTPDGWEERDFRPGEEVVISAPLVRFDVEALYAGVELEPK